MTLAKKIEKRRRATMKGSKGKPSQYPIRNLHASREAKFDGDGWEHFYKQAMRKIAAEEKNRLRGLLYEMARSLQTIEPDALEAYDNNPIRLTDHLMENSEHILPFFYGYADLTNDEEFRRAARYLNDQTLGLAESEQVNDMLGIIGLDLLGGAAAVKMPPGKLRELADWGPNIYGVHYLYKQMSGGRDLEHMAEAIEPHAGKLEAHADVHQAAAELDQAIAAGAGEEELKGLQKRLQHNRSRLIAESTGFAPDYETTAKPMSAMERLGLDAGEILADSLNLGLSPRAFPWMRFGFEHSGIVPTTIQRTRAAAHTKNLDVSDPSIEGKQLAQSISGTSYEAGDTVTPEMRAELQQLGYDKVPAMEPESAAERYSRLGAEVSSTIIESEVGRRMLQRARTATAAPGKFRGLRRAGSALRGAGKTLMRGAPLISAPVAAVEGYYAMQPGAREDVSQRIADIYREEKDLPWYERAGRALADVGEGVTGFGDPQQARARLGALWGAAGPGGRSREEIQREVTREEAFREEMAQAAEDIQRVMPGLDPINAERIGRLVADRRRRIDEGERAGPGYVADESLRQRVENMSPEEIQTQLTDAQAQAYAAQSLDEVLPYVLRADHPYKVETVENARRLMHQMGPHAFEQVFLPVASDPQLVPVQKSVGRILTRSVGGIPRGTTVTPETVWKLYDAGVKEVPTVTYHVNRNLMEKLERGSTTPEGEANLLPYRADPEKRPFVARFADRTEEPLRQRMEQGRERASKLRGRRIRRMAREHEKELREQERAEWTSEQAKRRQEMEQEFEDERQGWRRARQRHIQQLQEGQGRRLAEQSKLTQQVLDWSKGRHAPSRRPTIPSGVTQAEIAAHLRSAGEMTPGTARMIARATQAPTRPAAMPETRLGAYRGRLEAPPVDVSSPVAQNLPVETSPLDLIDSGS